MARQRTPVEPVQDWTLTAEQATAVDLLASGEDGIEAQRRQGTGPVPGTEAQGHGGGALHEPG
jgi:hypothetical protein